MGSLNFLQPIDRYGTTSWYTGEDIRSRHQRTGTQPTGLTPWEIDRRTGVTYDSKTTPENDPYGYYGIQPTGPQSAAPGEVDRYIRANYGYFAMFLDNPEIGPILRQAALEGWDVSKLQGAVYATNWWQNTDAANRTWQNLVNQDPAEARRLVNQSAATIQNRAKSLGLNLGSGQISSLATLATRNGWTDAQTVDYMLQQVNWANLEAGDLKALYDDVTAMAGDYLVNLSEGTAQQYAERIASGELSMEGVRSALVRQAKARFGWMESQLDQGITVKQYFAPVRDTIARELEVSAESIDMMDPKWLGIMETKDKDGNLGPASLYEAQMAARKDPRWARTRNAQEMTTNVVGMISDVFGLRGL